MCPRCARDVSEVCPRCSPGGFARDVPEMCPRCARGVPEVCPRWLCPRCAPGVLCARGVPEMCPRCARDCAPGVPQVCPRCASADYRVTLKRYINQECVHTVNQSYKNNKNPPNLNIKNVSIMEIITQFRNLT